MAGRSKLSRQPGGEAALARLIFAEGLTQREARARLKQEGFEVSKSALARDAKRLEEKIGRKLFLGRMLGEALAEPLQQAIGGKTAQLLEQSVLADLMEQLADDEKSEDKDVSVERKTKALRNLGQWKKWNLDAADKARLVDQASKLAETTETAMKAHGVSQETIDKIKAGILGIAEAP